MGYINELLTKVFRDIITKIIKVTGVPKTAKFLDDIKDLGYYMAFKGGLSFNLSDVVIPREKDILIDKARSEVQEVVMNYNMGLITNNERYNQIIDIWTHTNSRLTHTLMDKLQSDKVFNSIYMMMTLCKRIKKANKTAFWNERIDGKATKIWSFRWSRHH